QHAVAAHDRARRREIERHHGNILRADIVPHIKLGPIRQRKNPHSFARRKLAIEQIPQLGPLPARIPSMSWSSHRKDPLLRAAYLLVSSRPADRGVEAVVIERALKRLGFHDAGMERRSRVDRVDVLRNAFLVHIDDQFEAKPFRGLVTKRDHVPEFPPSIDMEQRKGRFYWEERLA